MNAKPRVKSSGTSINHHHHQAAVKTGFSVKTEVKAGGITLNHSQTLVGGRPE